MMNIERAIEVGFVVAFVVLGVAALVGVMMGAWWHCWTVVVCGLLGWMQVKEIKEAARHHKEGTHKGEAA